MGYWWLHLSDLHLGASTDRGRWRAIEARFLDDLDTQLHKRQARVSIVLVTGDLACKGQEYDHVQAFVDKLNGRFGGPREAPLWMTVPGNHDVLRPTQRRDRQACQVFDAYDQDDNPHSQELKQELWVKRDPSFVRPLFEPYLDWHRDHIAPRLSHVSWFPGDSACVLESGGFRLGVIGLNSSWAHYRDVKPGRLFVEPDQLEHALPEGQRETFFDPARGGVHRTLLLMHHPPEWLSPSSRRVFMRDIFRPERITLLLFGHLHEASSVSVARSGGQARLHLQAPSLFGLSHYGDELERGTFGYTLGHIDARGEVLVWPRTIVEKGDGTIAFDVDTSFGDRRADDGVRIRAPDEPATGRSPVKAAAPAQQAEIDRYLAWAREELCKLPMVGMGAGDQPARWDDLLVPTCAKTRREHRDLEPKDKIRGFDELPESERRFDIDEAFAHAADANLVLFGEPGAGKTTALLRLVAQLADGQPLADLPDGAVPFFLRLRRFRREHLDDLPAFMGAELKKASGGTYGQTFACKMLERGPVLLCLDGLDEIPDHELRREVAEFIGKTCRARHRDGVRAVVTSRYPDDLSLGRRFITMDLMPLDDAQIECLAACWFQAAENLRAQDGGDPVGDSTTRARRLMEALAHEQASPLPRDLVATPLFLTLLCLIVLREGTIPPSRVSFFKKCLEILLGSWPREKGHRVDWTADAAVAALRPLALAMHEDGQKDWPRGQVEATLVEHLRKLGQKLPDAPTFRDWCERITGLLREVDDDRVGFMHLGFQEYLAAARIAQAQDRVTKLGGRFGESWWEEVTLLLAGMTDHDTFEPLVGAIAKKDGLVAHRALLGRLFEEASDSGLAPVRTAVADETVSVEAKAELLRALGDVQDEALAAAVEPLVDHENRDLAMLARRVRGESARPISGLESVPATPASYEEPISGIRFLYVPGGRFEMGANDISDRERPPHFVRVSAFWLGETAVTNAQYGRFVEATGHRAPEYMEQRRFSRPHQPVIGVTWHDAVAFCVWLGEATGRNVGLPSEAQWELAARGTDGRRYPWGDAEPTATLADFGREYSEGPAPVGSHPEGRGPYGHLDLAGNVWEWCQDVLDGKAYKKRAGDDSLDPVVTEDGGVRARRGGAFFSPALGLRAAFRYGVRAVNRSGSTGFRVCLRPASTGVSGGGAP